jgi:hypothetical protein
MEFKKWLNESSSWLTSRGLSKPKEDNNDNKIELLKNKEKEILKQMELLKDSQGRLMGFNPHAYRELLKSLKDIRAKIEDHVSIS